ncbi:MAG: DUF4282 domain-containing protein [bacterium]|nr:MAG: DUF4282 domain-containing protein [bacterium]
MEDTKEFFSKLFDFSFSELITTQIIKVLYGIGILAAAIVALIFIIWGFQGGAFAAIIAIILSPAVFIICTILARVYIEVIIVLFQIKDNTSTMVKQKQE